jgi:hypothetical protein
VSFDMVEKTLKERCMEIIEYLRKSGRKPKRDDEGKIIVKGSGVGRQKKGVFFCGNDPEDPNSVIVGFSLCNKLDEFDYIDGQQEPGFGLDLAKSRAEKWADYTGYFVQNSWTEDDFENGEDLIGFINPDTKTIVEVPPSVIRPLTKFIKRCRRYYQDKDFPVWIEKIEQGQPEDIINYINYTVETWEDKGDWVLTDE